MFYQSTNVTMKANGKFSTIFSERQGAPQGHLPSPRHFCNYTVPLNTYLTSENVGYEAAGHNWALLLIADDRCKLRLIASDRF